MKTKKHIILTCLAVVGLFCLIMYLSSTSKVIENEAGFYIKNTSRKPMIFIYEINGDETNIEKTKLILPSDVYFISKHDYHDAKKIRVVGHINPYDYEKTNNH